MPDEARIVRGRLVEHGAANYKFRDKASLSYYVRVETDTGVRDVWGKDFERAIQQSASKVKEGDAVVLNHVGEKPVTVSERRLDENGNFLRIEKVLRDSQRMERRAARVSGRARQDCERRAGCDGRPETSDTGAFEFGRNLHGAQSRGTHCRAPLL